VLLRASFKRGENGTSSISIFVVGKRISKAFTSGTRTEGDEMKAQFAGRKLAFSLFVCFTMLLLCVSLAEAQVEKATLSGTVMDASGAVIIGAKIQATNVNTGVTYSGVTDGQGRYLLLEMQVGTYQVSAQKAGFQEMVQSGVVLTVGARPLLDFKLQVGQAEQVVEVQSQATRVDTETAAVGQLVSSNQMENLPINGRNFASLITLAPGVASVPPSAGGGGQSSTVYGNQTNYSVSGSRPVGTAYMLDNEDIRDWLDHGAGVSIMGTSLGMEAIQEFQILTNTYGAQFGGTGAAVNAVTKSGTNSLHGSLYEYVRNSALDAKNYFDVKKPSFSRNQFGGSVGGPIKKDKAFFFFNYEGLRASLAATQRAVVPVSADAVFNYGGYPGGVGVNPTVEAIFNGGFYPAPQTPAECPNVYNTPLTDGVTGLYCSANPQTGSEDYVLGRVDYNLGAKDSLFGRYVLERANQLIPYANTPVPGFPEADFERNQYITLEERHIFSPRVVNEIRVGYVRSYMETSNPGAASNSGPLAPIPGRPSMSFITPGLFLSNLGPSASSPSRPVNNRYSIGDDVIMSLGAHSLRFGATVSRAQLNLIWNQYSGGAWIFNNSLALSLSGIPLLCVCAADPSYAYTAPGGNVYPFSDRAHWRQTWLEPYIQDDWKITNRLTLNIGLRYEWASNPTTVGQPIFVIPNLTTTATQHDFVTAQHPFTSNPNIKNFDPRIGLAWDVFGDHKTAVRAGFGIFHEPVTARTYALDNTSMRPNEPLFFMFFDAGFVPNGFPNLPNDPTQLLPTWINGAIGPGPQQAENTIAWYYGILQNVDTAPYVVQYNLNVQRELGKGTVLTVGYNGSAGVHLFYWINANPPLAFSDLSATDQANALASGNYPGTSGSGADGTGARGTLNNPFMNTYTNPNFGAFESVQPKAHSSYNSLQLNLTRQMAKDLVGNASFTWSKCIDNASATISTEQGEWAVVNPYNPAWDRGPCSFSSNRVFTASALYRLPFNGNRLVDGWQVSPIINYSQGLPINVQSMFGGLYQSQTGGATEGERPQRLPGCNPMVRKVSQWWDTHCYVFAPFGTLGNSGRDSILNPNYSNIDFAIFKDTKLTEKLTMQIRAEFFDVLNHPNFVVGPQVYLMSPANVVSPSSAGANYSLLNTASAYELPNPATAYPGGLLCNPGQDPNATTPPGPCYTPSTALTTTVPGDKGGQRQIQFAVKFMF
jgi:hypothetical protein